MKALKFTMIAIAAILMLIGMFNDTYLIAGCCLGIAWWCGMELFSQFDKDAGPVTSATWTTIAVIMGAGVVMLATGIALSQPLLWVPGIVAATAPVFALLWHDRMSVEFKAFMQGQ